MTRHVDLQNHGIEFMKTHALVLGVCRYKPRHGLACQYNPDRPPWGAYRFETRALAAIQILRRCDPEPAGGVFEGRAIAAPSMPCSLPKRSKSIPFFLRPTALSAFG
jgi:hypothetical protein